MISQATNETTVKVQAFYLSDVYYSFHIKIRDFFLYVEFINSGRKFSTLDKDEN